MGNASSITTTDPFPVNAKTLTNLGRITYGTARILNTEDIYNLFNLNAQGPCGNYVVFKKKNIGIQIPIVPIVLLLISHFKSLRPTFVFLQWCLSEAASCPTKLNVERRENFKLTRHGTIAETCCWLLCFLTNLFSTLNPVGKVLISVILIPVVTLNPVR